MPPEIKVKIQKSPIPIIWLDTSIVNNIVKWKFGIGRPLEKTASERAQWLYRRIYDLTQDGKLICPKSEQSNEVWIDREKWMKIMDELSIGITTSVQQSIHDKQIRHFMIAHIRNERVIELTFQEAFISDPIEELQRKFTSPYYVCVDSGIIGGHENLKHTKKNVRKEQDVVRANNVLRGVTFEKQLEIEFLGEMQALISLSKEFISNACKSVAEESNAFWGYHNLCRQIQWWEQLGGSPKGIKGLIEFHKSSYYRTMPYTNLSSRLTAYIMTKKEPIKPGDSTDIDHISTLMPHVDLFVTDKAMRNIIKRQKLDILYNTEVCYIGDTESINNFFPSCRDFIIQRKIIQTIYQVSRV